MAESIKKKIRRFYSLISNYVEGAPDTRYKSWEWCHKAFLEKRMDNSEENIEYLSLHLAFYLASWGMYRGSSYLLRRDYKAHKTAIREILKPEYDELWDYAPTENNINRVNDLLFDKENGIYWKVKNSYLGYNEENVDADLNKNDKSSDTLTTKILMGTFGCIPAFDRFLKSGISCFNLNHGGRTTKIRDHTLTQTIESKKTDGTIEASDSFKALASLVLENPGAFQLDSEFHYPPMKCVDMYFWEIGYELDLAKGLVDKKPSQEKKNKLKLRAIQMSLCNANDTFLEASEKIFKLNK